MTPEIVQRAMERRRHLKITFHYPDHDVVAYAKNAKQFEIWQGQAKASGLQFSC